MPPQIATFAFAVGIWALFVLDRDRTTRPSSALWLPVLWLWIASSRTVAQWLSAAGLVNLQPLGADPSDLYLDGSPLDRNVFTALLALGIVVLFKRRRQVATLLRANKPILLLLSYCELS